MTGNEIPTSPIHRVSRRTLLLAISAAGLTGHPLLVQAQKKVARIGVLATSKLFLVRFAAFRDGMRDLGYVEGTSIVYEIRQADGTLARLEAVAAELASARVDLIFTASAEGVRAAQKASRTIPIVFGTVQDPLASGIVKNLARPDTNSTGMSAIAPDLGRKRLELLKEAAPAIARVAVFWSPLSPGSEAGLKEIQIAGPSLGVQIQSLEVRSAQDLEKAFQAALRGQAQGLTTAPDPLINVESTRIVGFAAANRLPAVYAAPEFMENGGLMSYAPNYGDLWRRAATHADRILKGARPADLPIEQPTKFELTVNLKTARSLGLRIPQSVLVRADRVIE